MRILKANEVSFSIDAEVDDIPVRGYAIASGDPEVDARIEDEILERLDNGDHWAWCAITVTARADGFEGSAHLGGCSYASRADFESDGYYEDLKIEALAELNRERLTAYRKLTADERNGQNVHSDSWFRDAFLYGAARAIFVSCYADFIEDGAELVDGIEYPRPGAGGDWYDYAPERMPPNAYAYAGQLWESLERLNGVSVYVLANRAAEADGVDDIDVEEFGRLLAMAYMGHGVSWFDDHKRFKINVPWTEISAMSFDNDAYLPEEF